MPIDVKKIKGRVEEATVEYHGDTAKVEYYPDIITVEEVKKVDTAQREGNIDVLFEVLVELVKSWEFTYDGDPIPVSEAGMRLLPIPLLFKLFWSLQEDDANPEAERPSNGS